MFDRTGMVRSVVAIGLAAAGLAGCGGGDGDASGTPAAPAAPAASTAEGVYGGTLTGSTSANFELLVLENGEYWALYGQQTASAFLVAGFLQGTGSASAGSFTSSNLRDFGYLSPLQGSVSATYDTTARTIQGTTTAQGGSVGFSGGPIAGSTYSYDTAASLATVTGAWSLSDLKGNPISISVAGNGSFTAASAGCSMSGSLAPRPSGKNVFNFSLAFGPAPCTLPGTSASGVALSYPLSNGKTQLLVAGVNSARTAGMAAFGSR